MKEKTRFSENAVSEICLTGIWKEQFANAVREQLQKIGKSIDEEFIQKIISLHIPIDPLLSPVLRQLLKVRLRQQQRQQLPQHRQQLSDKPTNKDLIRAVDSTRLMVQVKLDALNKLRLCSNSEDLPKSIQDNCYQAAYKEHKRNKHKDWLLDEDSVWATQKNRWSYAVGRTERAKQAQINQQVALKESLQSKTGPKPEQPKEIAFRWLITVTRNLGISPTPTLMKILFKANNIPIGKDEKRILARHVRRSRIKQIEIRLRNALDYYLKVLRFFNPMRNRAGNNLQSILVQGMSLLIDEDKNSKSA